MDLVEDATLKKFQKELNAGTVSLVLLAILDRSAEPLYGYQIAKSIEGAWGEGVPVKQGTLYPVLRSMEENGLLHSRVEPSVSGPPRKYYSITDRGRAVLGDWKAAWERTRSLRRCDTGGERWLTRSRDTSLNSERRSPGADPALVQDAVYDAEDYLRNAVAEGDGSPEAVEAAIEAYGTPEEIATAYRESRDHRRGRAAQAGVVGASQQAWDARRSGGSSASSWTRRPRARSSTCCSRSRPASSTSRIVVTGLSLTFGLAILIIGHPVRAAVPGSGSRDLAGRGPHGRGAARRAHAEKAADAGRAGQPVDAHQVWLADYRTWTTMLYMVLQLPLGIIYFTIIVTALSLSAAVIVAADRAGRRRTSRSSGTSSTATASSRGRCRWSWRWASSASS